MVRALALLGAALALAGCLESVLPLGGVAGPSEWHVDVEPSMAPDFSGDGDSYPVLLVHQHHTPSQRQQEEWRNVVCSTTDGERIELLPKAEKPSADVAMTLCAAPPADAATGRLFLERAAYAAAAPRGVLVAMDPCAGGSVLLDQATREVDISAPGHTFRVELHDNRTFSVDGRWIEPGTALKMAYTLNAGDEQDEEHVRIVFDHPGEWLETRVAPWDPDLDGPVPPRPDEGTGLSLSVPLDAATPRDILDSALAATPGTVTSIDALRLVHDGTRLTEAALSLRTTDGEVTWYGAGRTGHTLRLLGAQGFGAHDPGVEPDALLPLLDAPWHDLRAGVAGELTDVRLDAQTAWRSTADLPLGIDPALHPQGCRDGCVLVKNEDPLMGEGWRMLLAPERQDANHAATLHIIAYAGEDDAAEVWWHEAVQPR